MDGINQNNNNPYQPNAPYSHRNPKSAGTRIAVGIACALVILVGIGVGVLAYYRSTPSYKISRGLMNLAWEIGQTENPLAEKVGMDGIMDMMRTDGGHVETVLNFTADASSQGRVTFGVDTDFSKDVHARELSADTSISVRNYEFAHLNIYANDEVFCFSVPELFLEDMYIKNKNIVSQYNDSVFGQWFPIDIEERDINLFPDEDEGISLRTWNDLITGNKDLKEKVDACKDAMTIEKAENGLYRVTFPRRETDRLIKSLLKSVYDGDNVLQLWQGYKKLIDSDIRLLFELGDRNRIESIMLESPIKMLDGEASLDGEIFFLGDLRSIDKIQGKIKVDGVDTESREVLCQIQQTSGKDAYQMDMDFKYLGAGETLGKMKYIVGCDAVKDKFDMSFSLKDEWESVRLVMEGGLDDIVKGKSLEIGLNELSLSVNDQEIVKITGDIGIEPLDRAVKSDVKPRTAFFEMTYADWLAFLYRIGGEQGLYDDLWDSIR